jgi:hypothetical protein
MKKISPDNKLVKSRLHKSHLYLRLYFFFFFFFYLGGLRSLAYAH